MVVKAIQGLVHFKEPGLPDQRTLDSDFLRESIPEIEQANSLEDAVVLLETHLGFLERDMLFVPKSSPIGAI